MIGRSFLALVVMAGSLWLASLAGCQPAAPPAWQWERVEAGLPHQALVTAVAIDPTDPAQLWVGYYAPGGLARSSDGGQSWLTGGPGLVDNPVFDLVAVVPAGQQQVWAAARDGLFYSLDEGATWQPASAGLPAAAAFALAADEAGRVYAGFAGPSLYVRDWTDGTWQPLPWGLALAAGQPGGPATSPAAVLSLAVSADGRQLYAGTSGQGILASRDGGQSWTRTYPGRYAPDVALNRANPALAVASLRDRLIRTHDGGQSWHSLPVAWAQDEITSLLWLADGSLGAGTGRGQLYRSLDGGDTWLAGGEGLPVRDSVLDLAASVQPGPNGVWRLLAGTWNGLYASDDGGATWQPLAPDLGPPHIAALLANGPDLLLASRAGLFRWQPDRRAWAAIPANFPSGLKSLAAAPADPRVVYAGTVAEGLYRSDDGGTTWQRVPSLGVGIPAVAVHPADPNHVYILAAWERVYESKDGGQTWRARWDGLGVTTEAASIAIDPVEPLTVYVGADTGLYRSRQGQPWDLVAATLADQTVLAILAEPRSGAAGTGSTLYLGATRGIYRSLNGGSTVQPSNGAGGWGAGLAGVSVTALLLDHRQPGRFYAGTAYAGVYQSTDWGETWQPIGPAGLAAEVVESMAWGPDGELFVAAAGGVWAGR